MASTINAKNTSTGVVITPDASGQLELQTADTTRMTITSGGNVGIGTSSPTSALVVSGAISGSPTVDGVHLGTLSGYAAIELCGTSGTGSVVDFTKSGSDNLGRILYDNTNNYMAINTNSLERMRIDSSGNVGIGTSSPATRLNVAGGDLRLGDNFAINWGGTGAAIIGANNSLLRFDVNGAERMRIDSSGNLLIGRTNNPSGFTSGLYVTGAYSTTTPSGANVFINTDGSFFRSTSSIKYKTNVENYAKGLDDLSKLRPVTYQAKEGINTEQVFAGFVAEEVHEVGLTEFVQYAEDGTPDALSYGNMVALCVKAIQELKAELDTVKAELAELKGAA